MSAAPRLLAALVPLALLSSPAGAQQRPRAALSGAVVEGDTVRVRLESAPSYWLVLRVTGGDSLSVTGAARGDTTYAFRHDQLRALERYDGLRTSGEGARHGAWSGAKAGLLATAGLMVVGQLAIRCGDDELVCIPGWGVGLLAGGFTTGVLTVGGAIVGAASPGERWTRIRLDRLPPVTPVVRRSPVFGWQVGLRLRG